MADSKVTRIEETFGTLKRRGSRPGSCPQRSMVLSHWRNCNLCSRRGKDIKQKTVILQGNAPYILVHHGRPTWWQKACILKQIWDMQLPTRPNKNANLYQWAANQKAIMGSATHTDPADVKSWRMWPELKTVYSEFWILTNSLVQQTPPTPPLRLKPLPSLYKQSTHKNPCGRRFSTAGIKAMDPVKFIPELQERECVVYTWNYLYLCMWSKRP